MSRRKQNRSTWSWQPSRPLWTWLRDGTRGRNERVVLTYSRRGEAPAYASRYYRAWHQAWRYAEYGKHIEALEGRIIGTLRLLGVET